RRRHTRFSRDWSSDVCSSDLRVGVRGAVVDAMLNVADPATADTLAARLSELRGVLERKGLEPGTLRVRPSMDGGDILEAARAMRSEERRVGREWWRKSGENE